MELLIPGEDEEETEAFRQRVLDSFQTQAFGGNQADYRPRYSKASSAIAGATPSQSIEPSRLSRELQ